MALVIFCEGVPLWEAHCWARLVEHGAGCGDSMPAMTAITTLVNLSFGLLYLFPEQVSCLIYIQIKTIHSSAALKLIQK